MRFVDHTGEVWGNREITGRGEWKRYGKGHGFWTWRWKCLECGATGTAHQYLEIKRHDHRCQGKASGGRHTVTDLIEKYVPPEKKASTAHLCSKQCRKCKYYSFDGRLCEYYLKTGKRRPKVDLRHEPCPVRDTSQKPKVNLIFGEVSDDDT